VSAVQTVVITLAAFVVDRVGKKFLLIVSAVVIVMAHVGLGTFFHYASLGQSFQAFQCTAPWVINIFLYALVVGYSLGYAVLPFAIMSEVFPVQLASFLAPLTTLVNMAYGYVLVHYFSDAINNLPPGCIFWTFAIVTAFSILLIVLGVPETKGKTLSQLQSLFHPKWAVLDAEKDRTLDTNVTFDKSNYVHDIFQNRGADKETEYLGYPVKMM